MMFLETSISVGELSISSAMNSSRQFSLKCFSTKFPTLQVEGSIAVSSQGAIYMGLYEGFSNVTLALCKWFMIFFSPDFLLLNCKKTGYFIPSEINPHTLCMYHLNPNGYDFLGMRIWRPDELNSQALPLGCHDIIRRS